MEIKNYDNAFEEKTAEDILVAECVFGFIWVNDGVHSALLHPENEYAKNYKLGKTETFFPDAFRRVPPFSTSPLYLHDIMYALAKMHLTVSMHTDDALLSMLYDVVVYNAREVDRPRKHYESASTPQHAVALAALDFFNQKENISVLEERLKASL